MQIYNVRLMESVSVQFICALTYKCDPHGQSRPINAEVLQNVISHETQDGETWSVTCMVDLKEDKQVQVSYTAIEFILYLYIERVMYKTYMSSCRQRNICRENCFITFVTT